MSVPAAERLSAGRILSHLAVMVAVAAVMGVVVAGLAIPFAGALGIGARGVASSIKELPASLETSDLAQKTQIVDASGNVIATLYDENRITVPLSQISRKMVKAIVAIEDYRFYQHGALDLKGTLRALVTNQASSGVVQGGSSITQQMVKLTLVDQAKTKREMNAATDDTYARKFNELRYAVAFEQNYSKDWILERYLNIAYFGDGVYGIQAAAKHYFDTNAKDLDLRQSAMLAGLVKNPTGYDPTNAPDRALERRNVVLDRMAQLNVIKTKKADKLKEQGLGLDVVQTRNGCVFSRAPFFCDYVVNYLMKDPQLGKNPAERKELLYSGGLTIRTTIDLAMQDAADESVSTHVFPQDNALGGLAGVEPRTGNVKFIAQSRPMGRDKAAGQTYLNYVVPEKYGDSRGFQAGSTFKVFVLAAAIEQGIPLSQTINSPETLTLEKSDFSDCGGAPYSYGPWPVSNSTTSGLKDMYTGTRESVNTFYAQLEMKTGLCDPYRLAKQMGIELTSPGGDADGNGAERVASFVLGVPSTSPLEMAEAYATFAGRGLHCPSRPVTAIEDSGGSQIREYATDCRQVMAGPTADAVNDILRGVQEPGGFGYGAGINLSQVSAGKTGTINENRAVWFVGYTPNLATSSMIAGADSNGNWVSLNGQTLAGSYVASAFGSTTAGPMWGDAMKAIEPALADDDFVAPRGEDVQGVQQLVPDLGGLSVEAARSQLEALGFGVTISGYVRSAYPVDTVAYTYPAAGDSFTSGDTIALYQSDGTPPPKPGNKGGGGGRGNGNGKGGGNGNGR
ncbi:MAG: penicillin-binding protein [Nocardioides sp.]